MSSRSKNQHWVPRFYLRHFATPETRDAEEAQIWIFSNSKEDGDERLTNIKNVCAKRYLYSPRDLAGQRSWTLDEKLSDLESQLASLWPSVATKLLDFGPEDIRRAMALFVSLMHLRGPDTLRSVADTHRGLVSLLGTAPTNADGTPNVEIVDHSGDAQMLDTRDWEQYRKANADDHQRFFVDLIQTEATRLAELLMRKRWCVLFADTDAFVTSDCPVSVHHRSRNACGFGTPGSIVIFPLTPRRVLVMDDQLVEPPNQYYRLSPDSIGPLNGLIWRSGRWLLTGRSVPAVLNEVVSSEAGSGC